MIVSLYSLSALKRLSFDVQNASYISTIGSSGLSEINLEICSGSISNDRDKGSDKRVDVFE